MIRIASVATALLFAWAGPALAQDATKADPGHYKAEFENDAVRVLRITYGPGEKSVMHYHPAAVAVAVTDAAMIMHMPDGSTVDSPMSAGEAVWTPEVTHQPENTGNEEVVVILIEMKHEHLDHEHMDHEHMDHEHEDDDMK